MNDSHLKMSPTGIPCDFMYKIITFKFSKPRLSPFCSCWWNLLAIFHLFSSFLSWYVNTHMHTYIHICVYIHTYIHTYSHMHMCIHTCTYTYTCTHMCRYTYMHTYMHAYRHVCTCVMCLCAHLPARVHMCAMHVYMCTYTHNLKHCLQQHAVEWQDYSPFPTPFLSLYHR